MKKTPLLLAGLLSAFLAATAPAQESAPDADASLSPEQITEILKTEWSFLKEKSDAFFAEIQSKGEFETTPEFEKRVAARRQIFQAEIAKRIKDEKLDTRQFGVLLKANLVSYNADKQTYAVACSVTVQAPYDIPTLVSYIPTNPYIAIQDTVLGGYRTNQMVMRFRPSWSWSVDRATAMEAKADESAVYFRIQFMIDINQPGIKQQALLRIVPKGIELVNTNQRKTLWRSAIS
ncbi:MAG: hypothetical protein MUE68_04655 [Bacteroidetes bacterium]|jgi:hypothetical protein|nr:hypothetical protein [Bacteroidota bacterium]